MPFRLRREKSEIRRPQITAAALELLQHTPLAALSTRTIARHLGISQPALFRHFKSRDAILLAAVADARAGLAAAATRIIESGAPPLIALRGFVEAMLRHVQDSPGLVRLLFAFPSDADLARALRHLMSMQMAFAAELLRMAQARCQIGAALDPEEAARGLVALLQGTIVQWQVDPTRAAPFIEDGLALADRWIAMLQGAPDDEAPAAVAAPDDDDDNDEAAAAAAIRELDVRPTLADGEDPLAQITAAVRSLPPGGVLKLLAPFRPRPLLALMQQHGHGVRDMQLARDLWQVEVVIGAHPVEDLRELEAPQPLERVLLAAAALQPGACFLARVPRFPAPLIEQLRSRGQFRWAVYQETDGTALIRLVRPGDGSVSADAAPPPARSSR